MIVIYDESASAWLNSRMLVHKHYYINFDILIPNKILVTCYIIIYQNLYNNIL